MTVTDPITMQPQYAIVPAQSAALAPVDPARATTQLQPYVQQLPPHMYYTPPSPPTAAPEETLISIGDIIRWLTTYWKRGVLMALPLAAVTFYMLGFGKKVYEGEAMMQVQIQDNALLKMGKEGNGLSELSAPQIINNHRTGLKTRRFVDYLFTKIDKADRDALLGPVGQVSWRTKLLMNLGMKGPPKAMPPEELFNKLVTEFVRIEPVKDSHVLRIIVTGGDPVIVSNLANHYVNDYIDYVGNDSVEGARSAFTQLTSKVADAKGRLDEAEKSLADFNQKSDLLKSGDASDLSTMRADNLEKARSDVEVELLRSQERVRQLKSALQDGRDPAGIKGLGDDSQIVELQKKLIETRSKYDSLLEWCGPEHPKLKRANEEIQRMQRETKGRIAAIIDAAEGDEARLKSEHDRLTQTLTGARGEAFGQSDARIRQKQLRDQVDSLRQLYAELTQHQDRARLASELRSDANLSVKDIAVPPDEPVSPRKSIAFVAALMVMGLMTVGVPIGSGIAHDHVFPMLRKARSEGASGRSPGATNFNPVHQEPEPFPFAAAPAPQANPFQPAPQPLPQESAGIIAEIPELMAGEGPVQLSELLHPNPLGGGDAITPISTLLERHRAQRQGGTGIILVTSANVGEGKSMLCSALSASLCALGRSVFLMECNPAAPSIQNWFPQAGANSSWTNDLETLRYGYSNLFLLPAHDLPSYEMSDLIDGYRAWIGRAQARGIDWIIIDGASLLRGFADVAQFAPGSTDILFIHDPTRCDTEQVKAGINLLRPLVTLDALRGMILNRQSTQDVMTGTGQSW